MNEIRFPIERYSDIDKAAKMLDQFATEALNKNKVANFYCCSDSGMTKAQRGALHVWCKMVAELLNHEGLYHEYKSPVKGVEMQSEWTMYMIKDLMYKPVLKALSGKQSTEDQSTVEPSQVAEVILRSFGAKGVVLPEWPSNK